MKKSNIIEKYLSNHFDNLTGLYSREYFYLIVKKTISEDTKNNWYIICSNIDEFKLINDLYGRKKGDEILKQMACCISELGNGKNICARISGDRFAVCLPENKYSEKDLIKISELLNQKFRQNTMPINIHFGVYKIKDSDSDISVAAGRAKRALKTIKSNVLKKIAYFDDDFMLREENERNIITTFDSAIKNGEYVIYLQPQFSSMDGLLGAEVLVRWLNPKKGIVGPNHFIGILEKTGLISKLDNCVWEQAAKLLSDWKGTDKEKLQLSINLSVKDFNNIDIYKTMTELVKRYDIPPQKLHLEITESVLMNNVEKVLETIQKLRNEGFFIEIDDFGKGYSSLSMLKDIDVDMIKIDMDFLRKTENTDKSLVILESIITMSKKLGLQVLTEGVETKAQIESLEELGCYQFQGYYFDKPISVEDFCRKYKSAILPEQCEV